MRIPLRDALARTPLEDVERVASIARAALAAGFVELAEEAATRGLAASPGHLGCATSAARATERRGDLERARDVMNDALARSEETGPARARALVELARLNDRLRDDGGRRAALELSLRAHDAHYVRIARADAAIDEGSLRRAEEELSRAEEDASETLHRLGVLSSRRGDTARAVELLSRAAASPNASPAARVEHVRTMGRARGPEDALFIERLLLDVRLGRTFACFARPAARRDQLRVAYLLPDRADRLVPFVGPLLEHEGDRRFEARLVMRRPRDAGASWLTSKHRSMLVGDLEPLAVARRLMEGETDIAIAVGGHDLGDLLLALCARCAPVQVAWLDHGTTGLGAVDYRITDAQTDPSPSADAMHTERLVRLEPAALALEPWTRAPAPREDSRLAFGCFAPQDLLDDATLATFCDVLQATPGARLGIAIERADDEALTERVAAVARGRGVDPDRIELREVVDQEARRAFAAAIEVCLDPPGATDALACCEALAIGVPVVTCRVDRASGRLGASLLSAVGLASSIAKSPEELVVLASAWARDDARRQALRASLPEVFRTTLGDTRAFSERFHAALEAMWTEALDPVRSPEHEARPSPRGEGGRARSASLQKVAVGLLAQGAPDAAAAVATAATIADPVDAEAQNLLGNAFAALGDEHRAEEAWKQSRRADPTLFKPLANLANLTAKRGDAEIAVELFRLALERNPDAFRTHANLGATLVSIGLHEPAVAHLERSIALQPSPLALSRLAEVRLGQGDRRRALALLEAAQQLGPLGIEGELVLASALSGEGRAADASVVLERAAARRGASNVEVERALTALVDGSFFESAARIASSPGAPVATSLLKRIARGLEGAWSVARVDAWLGEVCSARRMIEATGVLEERLHARRDDAGLELALRRAVDLFPDSPSARRQLGVFLDGRGRHSEAKGPLREALLAEPLDAEAEWALLRIRGLEGDVDGAIAGLQALARARPELDLPPTIIAFMNYSDAVDPASVFEAHRAWGARIERHVERLPPPARAARPPRLKVAYLSPDLRDHSVARFIEPVLRAHDRARFEIHAYATHRVRDAVTTRIASLDLTFHHVAETSDHDLAARIARDGIDVLIELAGHTEHGTLGVLARRPCPVQVTYLGYPGTTGLRAIDYRITDAIADPPGRADELCTERLVRLPTTAWCYGPPADAPEPAARSSAPITFGSFNTLRKTTPRVVAAWSEILRSVPGARLFLKTGGLEAPEVRARLARNFEARGVDPSALVLRGWARDAKSHLETYGEIDVALDTFPYGGTTTTCEALWMGVPVVSLVGASHAGRVGASLLTTVGLGDLAAGDLESYVETARRLAADVERRAELRQSLRNRMRATPLVDAARFVRDLEDAIDRMYDDHLRAAPSAAPMDRVVVTLDEELRLVAPPETSDAPTREAGDDLDPLVPVARALLGRGDTFVDVGAGLGAVALVAAERVGASGSVLALEPDPVSRACLEASAREGGLAQLVVEEANLATDLVGEGRSESLGRALSGARLVRVSRRARGVDLLGLLDRSPEALIALEIDPGDGESSARVGLMRSRGVVVAEWVDGLRAFVAVDAIERLGTYALASPACVEALARAGHFVTGEVSVAALDASAEHHAWLSELAYAAGFFGAPRAWPLAITRHAIARHHPSPNVRLAALRGSLRAAYRDVEAAPSIARKLTLARITLDAGRHDLARELLAKLDREVRSADRVVLDEPFLCVVARYEALRGHDRPAAFARAQIAEARATRRGAASRGPSMSEIEQLHAVVAAGFADDALERRLATLIARLSG